MGFASRIPLLELKILEEKRNKVVRTDWRCTDCYLAHRSRANKSNGLLILAAVGGDNNLRTSGVYREHTMTGRLPVPLVLLLAWPYYMPLRHHSLLPTSRLAACTDNRQLQKSIEAWRTSRSRELHFVKIASTVSAAATVGVFSWPQVTGAYWLARALWYSSLTLSISAVITSAQHTSIIDSMAPTSREPLDTAELHYIRRVILRFSDTDPVAVDIEKNDFETTKPRFGARVMLYIWQCPMMLMAYSWVTFGLALTLFVCTPFITHQPWGDGKKIAIFYLASAGLILVNFIWTSAYTYNLPRRPSGETLFPQGGQTSSSSSRPGTPVLQTAEGEKRMPDEGGSNIMTRVFESAADDLSLSSHTRGMIIQ